MPIVSSIQACETSLAATCGVYAASVVAPVGIIGVNRKQRMYVLDFVASDQYNGTVS